MEIFKEEFDKSNLMFTDNFKSTSMSIAEFLANPNYYKIMLRSNTRVCLQLRKERNAYIAMANILDTRTGGWINLDYKINDSLYKAMIELNGLKDENKLDKNVIDEIQKYYESEEVYRIDIYNSEKENKISAKTHLIEDSSNKDKITKLVNEMISRLARTNKRG